MSCVREAFEKAADPAIREAIHSISARVKGRPNLARKIERKRNEQRLITKENFFEVIDDLAGVRVLTLYRWDFVEVHRFIQSESCWRVLKSEAFAWHFEDEERLSEAGLKVRKPKVEGEPYTSVHYTVAPSSETPVRCEIQVRSVHLDGWAEVDHRLKYPDKKPGRASSQLLRKTQMRLFRNN